MGDALLEALWSHGLRVGSLFGAVSGARGEKFWVSWFCAISCEQGFLGDVCSAHGARSERSGSVSQIGRLEARRGRGKFNSLLSHDTVDVFNDLSGVVKVANHVRH